jgi:hypothetical protein
MLAHRAWPKYRERDPRSTAVDRTINGSTRGRTASTSGPRR